jgi:hypothetical protein
MRTAIGRLLMLGGTLAAASPALAGAAAPVPVLAAGIPALLAVAGGYMIARKRRGG